MLERTKLVVNCGPIHSYLRLTAHTDGQIGSGQGGCHQQDPFLSHLTLTLIYSHSLDHFPLLLSIKLRVVLLFPFDGTIPRRLPQNAITSTLGSRLSPPNTSAGALRSNNTRIIHDHGRIFIASMVPCLDEEGDPNSHPRSRTSISGYRGGVKQLRATIVSCVNERLIGTIGYRTMPERPPFSTGSR